MTDWLAPLDLTNELVWYGKGSGGGWHVRIRLVSQGRYELVETLEHDFDVLGGAEPTSTTKQLDATAARAEIEDLVAQHAQPGVVRR